MAINPDSSSAQADTLIFIVPVLTSLAVVLSPVLVFASLTDGTLGRGFSVLLQITWVRPQRLSQLSVAIILLSPCLLLSHYIRSTLYLFALYSVLLALANLAADWLARKRSWLIMSFWHAMNLLNLLGGGFSSIFQLYYINNDGIVKTAAHGPFTANSATGYDCNMPADVEQITWCSNAWVTFQIAASFGYVILHVCTFGIVVFRALMQYGGEVLEDSTQAHANGDAPNLENLISNAAS